MSTPRSQWVLVYLYTLHVPRDDKDYGFGLGEGPYRGRDPVVLQVSGT